jgi:3-hydroxybutyryl-CoA dehydrogenase
MISRILVAGAGAMGSQIALTAALAGYQAVLSDIDDDRVTEARSGLADLLATRVGKGRITEADAQAALDRLTCTSDADAWAPSTDYVIEAAVEKLDVKRELFAHLDTLLPGTPSSPATPRASCPPGSPTPPPGRTASATCTSSIRR